MKTKNVNRNSAGFQVNPERYELMKKLVLRALPKRQSGITFADMVQRVREFPESTGFAKPMWYAKVVQLDLEARGLIARNCADKPMRLYKI